MRLMIDGQGDRIFSRSHARRELCSAAFDTFLLATIDAIERRNISMLASATPSAHESTR